MRRVLAIAWRVMRVETEPTSFLPWLLLPIIFTLIFGYMSQPLGQGGQRRYEVSLVNQGDGPLTARLAKEIELSPVLKIAATSEPEARRRVENGSVVAAVILPASLETDLLDGRSPGLTLVRQGETNVYLYARQEVERALTRVASAIAAADRGATEAGSAPAAARGSATWLAAVDTALARWSEAGISVSVTPVLPPGAGRPLRQVDQKAIGFALMMVFMGMMQASGSVLTERAAGTWQRLVATPATRAEVMGGYLTGHFTVGWLQFGLMVLETRLIFGANWGSPLGLLAVGSLFILTAVALGLALAGFVKTFQQQSALVALLGIATSMLAGLFWPLEATSKALQVAARGMPQYWASLGLTNTVARGLDWTTLAMPLLVLGAMTAVFMAVGIRRVRFD